MKKIRLLCRARGLDFGTTLEVGSEAGQISKEDALSLINDSLAEEAKESIDGTNVNLIKENKALKEEIATLKAEFEKAKPNVKEAKSADEKPAKK